MEKVEIYAKRIKLLCPRGNPTKKMLKTREGSEKNMRVQVPSTAGAQTYATENEKHRGLNKK